MACTQPPRAGVELTIADGQDAARGDDTVTPDQDGAVVQRRAIEENRLQKLAGDGAAHWHPCVANVLQIVLSFKDNERPDPVVGQVLDRAYKRRQRRLCLDPLEGEAAYTSPQLFKQIAKLRLEDDRDGDEDDDEKDLNQVVESGQRQENGDDEERRDDEERPPQ